MSGESEGEMKALILLCLFPLCNDWEKFPSRRERGIQIIDCWLDWGRGGKFNVPCRERILFAVNLEDPLLRSEGLERSRQICTHRHNFVPKIYISILFRIFKVLFWATYITYVPKFLAEFRFMSASIFMNNLSFMNLGLLRDRRHSGKYVPITTSLSSKLMYILDF